MKLSTLKLLTDLINQLEPSSAPAGLLFTFEPDKTRQNLIKLEALARVRVKNRPHEGKYVGAYLVFVLVLWCLFTVKRRERYNVKKRLFTTACAPS